MRRGSIATLELLRLRTAGVPLRDLSQLRCDETLRLLVDDPARAEAALEVEVARRGPALRRWIESEPCRDGLRASVDDPRAVLDRLRRAPDVAAPEQRLVVELLQRAGCLCDGYASLAPGGFGRLTTGDGPNLRVYEKPPARRLFLDAEPTRKLLRLCGSAASREQEVMEAAADPTSLDEEGAAPPEVREWLRMLRRLEQASDPSERDDLHRTLVQELARLTASVSGEPEDGRVQVEGRPAHADTFVEAVMRPVGVDVGGRLAQEIHTIARVFAAFEARICSVLARRLHAVPAPALWAEVDDRPEDTEALLDAVFDEAEEGLIRDVARLRRLPDLVLEYPLPPPFSLDVAISAPDAGAVAAGDYGLVLGEVHVEMTGLTTKSYFERAAFVRELAAVFASYGQPIRFSAFDNVHEDAFRARIAAFLLASAFEALDGAGPGEPKIWPYRGKPTTPPELEALLYFPLSVSSGVRLFYSRRRFLRGRRLSSCWFPGLVRRVLSHCDPDLAAKLEHRERRTAPVPPGAAGPIRDSRAVVEAWRLVESWRRAHEIPEAAYFHLPEAVSAKPIYVDFAVPELVLTLLDRCRASSASALWYSEMSPPPDRLWFADSGGHCCSELRTQSFAVFARPEHGA